MARMFTPEVEAEMGRSYEAGWTYKQIGLHFGCDHGTARNAVMRQGIKARRPGVRRTFTEEDRVAIRRRWQDGATLTRLAKDYKVGRPTIVDLLVSMDEEPVERRNGPRRFTNSQEDEMVRLYEEGWSYSQISERFGCSRWVPGKVMQRRGVPRRAKGRGPRDFTDEEQMDIARRWKSGEAQTSIAASYGAHQLTISRVLRHMGEEPAPRWASRSKVRGWKGGRLLTSSGYWMQLIDRDDPLAVMANTTGYVLEHRLVMARALGRPLTRNESVHHINGDRADNRLENLQLRAGKHGKGVVMVCCDCGSTNVEAQPLADTAD
ncbi:MAG: HNH endonuclease [Acidimicrobiales bacterium]